LSPRPTGFVIYRDGASEDFIEDINEYVDRFVQAGDISTAYVKNAFGT
jgi:hypothetical protein